MAAMLLLGACAQGTVQDALGMGKRAPDEFAVVRRAPLIVPPDFALRPPDPGAPRPTGTTSDKARAALTGGPRATSDDNAAMVFGGSGQNAAGTGPTAGVPGSVPAAAVADELLAAGTRAPVDGAPADAARTRAPGNPSVAAATRGDPALTAGEQAMVALAGGDQADPGIRRTIAAENQALADVEASLFTRIVKWRDPATMGATIDAPAEAQRLRANRIQGRPPTAGDTPVVIQRRQSALQGLLEGLF